MLLSASSSPPPHLPCHVHGRWKVDRGATMNEDANKTAHIGPASQPRQGGALWTRRDVVRLRLPLARPLSPAAVASGVLAWKMLGHWREGGGSGKVATGGSRVPPPYAQWPRPRSRCAPCPEAYFRGWPPQASQSVDFSHPRRCLQGGGSGPFSVASTTQGRPWRATRVHTSKENLWI